MSIYTVADYKYTSGQSRSFMCAPYHNGYVRLGTDLMLDSGADSGADTAAADEVYILPQDVAYMPVAIEDYPFLFVLGHFGDKTQPVVGLSAFNPSEFLNGHEILVRSIKQRMGISEDYYIALSGTLYFSKADGCVVFIDNSGHYYENIYPEIMRSVRAKMCGGDGKGYVDYINDNITPMMVYAFGGIECRFTPFNSASPPMIVTQYDTPAVFKRFRNRVCPKHIDYPVYADADECELAQSGAQTQAQAVAMFCEDEDAAVKKISRRKKELYTLRVPAALAPMVERLYNDTINDIDLLALQKHTGKVSPILPYTRNAIIARLKKAFPSAEEETCSSLTQ